MSCYHPLKAFVIRVNPDGTKKLKITSYQVDHVEKRRNGEDATVICTTQKEPLSINNEIIREFIEIPCGKCWGCRLDYSRNWANRMMMELEDHDEAWFVTLTYDNDHVPESAYADRETGEAIPVQTLCKRDWQLFMKRLRKEYSDSKIRFFCSGEYGSQTARPHYHAILFGLHFNEDELEFYKKSNNFKLYNSERLNRVWGKGYVVVAEVNWDTCAYTARYVLKKANGDLNKFYEEFNIEPEFCLMSRKPGLGKEYFERNYDRIYEYDKVNLSTTKKGISMKPPKYFDKLFDEIDHERLGEIKEQRKIAAERLKALELKRTNLDYIKYLAVKEKTAIDKQKILLRRNFREKES